MILFFSYQNQFVLSLRAIFDYFHVLSLAASEENFDEGEIVTEETKSSNLLPDSRYWQRLNETTASRIPSSSSLRDFFVFQYSLKKVSFRLPFNCLYFLFKEIVRLPFEFLFFVSDESKHLDCSFVLSGLVSQLQTKLP